MLIFGGEGGWGDLKEAVWLCQLRLKQNMETRDRVLRQVKAHVFFVFFFSVGSLPT